MTEQNWSEKIKEIIKDKGIVTDNTFEVSFYPVPGGVYGCMYEYFPEGQTNEYGMNHYYMKGSAESPEDFLNIYFSHKTPG